MRTIPMLLVLAGLALAGGAEDARALLDKGEAKAAVAAARKVVAGDPADIEGWLVLADAHFALDEPADAWTALEKAIEANPAEARLSLKLGDAFVKLAEKQQRTSGDGTTITNYYLDAERNYGEALEKDPKSADALFGMANVNFWLGREESKQKARKLLAECLAIDKDYAKAHALQAYMLYLDGSALAQQGDEDAAKEKYRAAQQKYEVALKLDDSDVLDHVRHGHTLYGQGKWEEAKAAYLAGLKRHPNSDVPIRSGLYHVANVGQSRASWANLKPYLEEAVKLVPASAPAWYYLGYCHSADEEWKDALKAYSRIIYKIMSTGTQVAPDMLQPDFFPDWGPDVVQVSDNLDVWRRAIPPETLHTTELAWDVSEKTRLELYLIWKLTGNLEMIEQIDEGIFMILEEVMEELLEEHGYDIDDVESVID